MSFLKVEGDFSDYLRLFFQSLALFQSSAFFQTSPFTVLGFFSVFGFRRSIFGCFFFSKTSPSGHKLVSFHSVECITDALDLSFNLPQFMYFPDRFTWYTSAISAFLFVFAYYGFVLTKQTLAIYGNLVPIGKISINNSHRSLTSWYLSIMFKSCIRTQIE